MHTTDNSLMNYHKLITNCVVKINNISSTTILMNFSGISYNAKINIIKLIFTY
jgi:hypothetical protein